MMQTVTLNVDGQVFEMPVNHAQLKKMAERVCDPLTVAMQVARGQAFEPTALEIISILYVGVQGTGSNLSEDEFGDLVIADGVIKHVETAVVYLMKLIEGRPEKPVKSSANKKKT